MVDKWIVKKLLSGTLTLPLGVLRKHNTAPEFAVPSMFNTDSYSICLLIQNPKHLRSQKQCLHTANLFHPRTTAQYVDH